jgi:serine/threonine protein phosphatase PrpC
VTVTDVSSTSPSSSGPHHGVVVHVFGRTDVGRTREHNEDAFVVADLTTGNATLQPEVRTHVSGDKGSLFMVADGMGGAAAGEVASAMAVEVVINELRRNWSESDDSSGEAFARALRRATGAANSAIHTYATAHPELKGMGTTATVAGLLGGTLYVAQVGDSRAYVVRDGVARQITKDQSLIQKLVEAGEMTEEEADASERKNIILQALGPDVYVKVDLTHQRVRSGDTLVLCSDGLSGQVPRDTIARVVAEEPDLMQVCKRLIDLANEAGGPDNITVIAARFEGALGSAAADDEVGHRVYPLPDTGQTAAIAPLSALDATTEPVPVQKRPTKPLPMDAITGGERSARTSPPQVGFARPSGPGAGSAGTGAPVPDETAGGAASVVGPKGGGAAPAPGAVPVVSPRRRSAGMFIALVLLLALILAGAWFVWQTAQKVTPRANDSAGGSATARV